MSHSSAHSSHQRPHSYNASIFVSNDVSFPSRDALLIRVTGATLTGVAIHGVKRQQLRWETV